MTPQPPAPTPTLSFVAGRTAYAAVHIVAVLAAATIATGIMALAGSLTRHSAWLLGRAGTTTAVIGTTIFGVESTSEGLALPELASAAQADPGQRADVVEVARAVAAATHGPSLVAIALFSGATLLQIGLSIRLEGYPAWLGIVGAIIGTATGCGRWRLILNVGRHAWARRSVGLGLWRTPLHAPRPHPCHPDSVGVRRAQLGG